MGGYGADVAGLGLEIGATGLFGGTLAHLAHGPEEPGDDGSDRSGGDGGDTAGEDADGAAADDERRERRLPGHHGHVRLVLMALGR